MSKSEAIRSCKAENPKMGPSAIAETLNKKGYDVSAQFVSTVLSNQRRKEGGQIKSADDLSISDMRITKELVKKLGGIENAKTALNAYTELISG